MTTYHHYNSNMMEHLALNMFLRGIQDTQTSQLWMTCQPNTSDKTRHLPLSTCPLHNYHTLWIRQRSKYLQYSSDTERLMLLD